MVLTILDSDHVCSFSSIWFWPAQLCRGEKRPQTSLVSFIQVKICHPCRPTALKAVCHQETPTAPGTCSRAVLKRGTQAQGLSPWAGSSPPKNSKKESATVSMCTMAENMQEQGRGFSPGLFLQFRLILYEQVRKYYQEMNLSEVIHAPGKT